MRTHSFSTQQKCPKRRISAVFAHFVRKRAEPKLVFHPPRSYEGTGHGNKKNAVTA
jgi:hypothetical protein